MSHGASHWVKNMSVYWRANMHSKQVNYSLFWGVFFAQIENQEFTVYAWVTLGAEYAWMSLNMP